MGRGITDERVRIGLQRLANLEKKGGSEQPVAKPTAPQDHAGMNPKKDLAKAGQDDQDAGKKAGADGGA